MPTKYLSVKKIEKICKKHCSLSAANTQKLVKTIRLAQQLAAQKGPEAVQRILNEILK
jgi:hypothetical protein